MPDAARSTPAGASIVPARRPWSLPTLRELPKLTDLTLASAIGGGGGTGGGGSTVFGLLLAVSSLAVFSLAGCSTDQMVGPSAPAMPKAVASIPCVGDVAAKSIRCGSLQAAGGAPLAAPGQEIIGGQGVRVMLRSEVVQYVGTDFTFYVTVQNLSDQILGSNGTSATDVRIFFVTAPVATGGSGTITVEDDSVGTFTAPGQAYYKYPGSLSPGSISPVVPWRFIIPPTVTTFAFQVLVAAEIIDQGGVLRWRAISGFTQRRYNDVAVSSPTDWMAVGSDGVTGRWNGTSWVALPASVPEDINAVTAVAPGEYYAVTAAGAVLHFKNDLWTEIYRRGDHGAFFAIWALDEHLIFAIGTGGKTSRLSNGAWTDEDLPTGDDAAGRGLAAVSGNASGTQVSILSNAVGGVEVWTWNDFSDAITLDPSFPLMGGLGTDLVYDDAGHALVGTRDLSVDPRGYIVSSTGEVLLFGRFLPRALFPTGTNKVAVGGWDYGGSEDTMVVELDYSSLPGSVTPLSGGLAFDIDDMAATNAAGTQFAVASPNQHLYRWDGASWSDPQGAGDGVDADLWGLGDTVWAVDGVGGFTRIMNGVPTSLPAPPGIFRLSGSASSPFPGSPSTTFFALDANNAWYSNGVGWDYLPIPFGTHPRDIWADLTGNSVVILTDNGTVSSFAGGSWQQWSTSKNLNAVWGCDANFAWIVTEEGEIWDWAFGSTGADPLFAGSPTPLRVVTGSSCTDVWVGGDDGAMYHWDGTAWSDLSHPSPGQRWGAITSRSAGEVMVAGAAGTAAIFMVGGGYQEFQLPTQGKTITALQRLANGDIYAAGANVLLRGLR